ncbi:MAG: CDP-alcohol phosphatidyltransferase family protein, partial [Polyangiaceae bacterium]
DAVDGMVARRSGRASVAGALLDASGDRYQEFLFLGGLAVYFRASILGLVTALFALAGSFMVSYGSAKAEAHRGPVPPGVMRRAERAVCLCAATAITAPWQSLVSGAALPAWAASLPLLIAMGLIAVVANASAVRRLWILGRMMGNESSAVDPRRLRAVAAPSAGLADSRSSPTEARPGS